MGERFERFQKMAKEEFGLTVIRNDKQETFKDMFGVEIDCDGRCLNCDCYEPITSECKREDI